MGENTFRTNLNRFLHQTLFPRVLTAVTALTFTLTGAFPVPLARAQQAAILPPAETISSPDPLFAPPLLKGVKVYLRTPFRVDFILDKGDTPPTDDQLKTDSSRLIRYFLAGLTIPENDLWVNLSPYEKDRIAPEAFGQTEMGRDLLAQDYILKQITASIINPEGAAGKVFWDKVYAETFKRYGTTDMPVDAFNKVWIVPEKAVVHESKDTVYVVESKLKVMLDSDYLAAGKANDSAGKSDAPPVQATEVLARNILREVIIPVLEKEVNEGKNFATLRQVYHSLILAIWYKHKLKDSLIGLAYVNKQKTGGIQIEDKNEKDKIWEQYVEAFKKGAYNFIREEIDPTTRLATPRKYVSGGVSFDKAMLTKDNNLRLPDNNRNLARIEVELIPQVNAMSVWDLFRKGHVSFKGLLPNNINELKLGISINRRLKLASARDPLRHPSALEYYLDRLFKNKEAGKLSETILSAVRDNRKIIIELGSGRTINAAKIALANPDALVIATDAYNSNPKTALEDYLPYARDFEAGMLPAQKIGLNNLIVLRSFADILLYLPDASVDNVVIVYPAIDILREFFLLIKSYDAHKKFKPGAKAAIITRDEDKVKSVAHIMRFGIQSHTKFLGVDLKENSDWSKARLLETAQMYLLIAHDNAMQINPGGIDLNPAGIDLKTSNNSEPVEFYVDPAVLKHLQHASGITPVIVGFQSMESLDAFFAAPSAAGK